MLLSMLQWRLELQDPVSSSFRCSTEDGGKAPKGRQDESYAILNHKGDLAFIALPRGYVLVVLVEGMKILDIVKVTSSRASQKQFLPYDRGGVMNVRAVLASHWSR